MGFDQNQPGPVVDVHKRTTKVNLWMVGAVLLFLAAGVILIWVVKTQAPGP
jgi:hypothetical protein